MPLMRMRWSVCVGSWGSSSGDRRCPS
jgi:hypothetical protein